jgi:hypothetical protein
MRDPKPPSLRDIADYADRMARGKRAGKKPIRKKPSPSAGKMMGPNKPKPPAKNMPKRIGDLREMGPRKPPAKTMPKQMGPKKTMKPKQMKMKRMGY